MATEELKERIYRLIDIREYHNVREILNALTIPDENILEVKHVLEDGISNKEIERVLKHGKPWYRVRR